MDSLSNISLQSDEDKEEGKDAEDGVEKKTKGKAGKDHRF